MERRYRRGFSTAEKTKLWDRWQRGESAPTVSAQRRLCVGRASRRPASGAGKNASWKKALMAFSATRPARRASRPWVQKWSSGWWRSDPPGEVTHWTAAMMATAAGISESAVRRIWRCHGLQPHRYRQFKLSNDPNFVGKLRDVVGLYVDPPTHAIVLSVDEKSQIQALDRTQPGLPMKKGRLGTMTHDYKRNGTTTLFVALHVLDGGRSSGATCSATGIRSSSAS